MKTKIITNEFRPGKAGLRKVLGDTEAEIMELVWEMGIVKVRDIYKILNHRRDVAYTTVMTVMQRLTDKDLLERVKKGKSYEYHALVSKDELIEKIVSEVIDGLWEEFSDLVCSYMVERIEKEDQ